MEHCKIHGDYILPGMVCRHCESETCEASGLCGNGHVAIMATENCEHRKTVARDGHIYCADCGVDVIGTGIPGGKERHKALEIKQGEATMFTAEDFKEMLRCARRELAMRQACYPKLVCNGQMAESDATRETNAQHNIVSHLEAIVATLDPQQQPDLPLAERDGA